MTELQERVRARLRERLLLHGASSAFDDRELFASVERLLQSAVTAGDANALILPELLGDPDTWRLQTALIHQSHRSSTAASIVLFVKRRVLMPMTRWLFEYSHDNFVRQLRVNQVLFACIQELAVENARLQQQMRAASTGVSAPVRPGAIEGR